MPKKTTSKRRLGRQEQRDLDIEISFLEGIVKRDPQFVQALKVLGDNYTRRGRWHEGLQVDEQLIQLCPDDPAAYYNLACSYSLTEKYDEAIAALERALNLGYNDLNWLARDPDLRNLRKYALFDKIRAMIKSLPPKIS